MKLFLISFFLLFASSCYKGNLYVQQEWINPSYLASSFVGSPDAKNTEAFQGQKILLGWDFPISLFEKGLQVEVTARLYDNTEQIFSKKLDYRRGAISYFFPNPNNVREKNLLTYKAVVTDSQGDVIDTWYHQLWTEKIEFDEE